MPKHVKSCDCLDCVVRRYGQELNRAAPPPITAADLEERGFVHAGGTGALLCRWVSRLRFDALPDLAGSYTSLWVRMEGGISVRFRFVSLEDWDVWLTAFERANP